MYYSLAWPPDAASPDPADIVRCITHYRGIKLLNHDCNMGFGKLVIPFTKLAVMFGFILAFFACFRLFQKMHIVSFALVAVGAFSCIIILIPTTIIMSNLYDTSVQFRLKLLPGIHRLTDPRMKKALEFALKSCSLIRFKVGNWYFMEAKAKLTLMHNLVNGVVFVMVNLKIRN